MIYNSKKPKASYTLKMILESPVSSNLPPKYIPELQELDSGLFIKTQDRDISLGSAQMKYIKFLLLNKDFKPIHGHDYDYAMVPKEGYLVRVVVPAIQPEDARDFTIDYIVDVNHIEIGDTLQTVETNGMNQSEKNVTIFNNYESFSLSKTFMEMINNREMFFDNFVKHVLK